MRSFYWFSIAMLVAGCDRHQIVCDKVAEQVGTHDGYEAPGTAGASTWGFPESTIETTRVRRSWSTLSAEDKRRVLDAFIALKSITVNSADPGSPRADYTSLCDEIGLEPYTRNLYDYYVEAHTNAFLSMGTPQEEMTQMSHMGPQFLPWHRYLLLRIEADMAEAIGDPTFALPYWDWQDCEGESGPGSCPAIFEPEFLGSAGACEEDASNVGGYLTDQGFQVNITTKWGELLFVPESIICSPRKLRRQVGCLEFGERAPNVEEVKAIFDRPVYDDEPNDSCNTDADISFRQYLEGYDDNDTEPSCVVTGCKMHSKGHIYVGGDMYHSSGSPNDPIFFLHHANVDRLWSAWQEANRAAGLDEDYGNPGYPDAYRGSLFVWEDIRADELFDYRALGYEYEALPAPN